LAAVWCGIGGYALAGDAQVVGCLARLAVYAPLYGVAVVPYLIVFQHTAPVPTVLWGAAAVASVLLYAYLTPRATRLTDTQLQRLGFLLTTVGGVLVLVQPALDLLSIAVT
jgi:hypothetical protein